MRAAGVSPSDEMASIARGSRPAAMPERVFAEYQAAIAALVQAGTDASQIAGLAVFTTDDPTTQLDVVLADMLSRPLPQPDTAIQQTDLFDDYCVYAATMAMPDYQAGSPPLRLFLHRRRLGVRRIWQAGTPADGGGGVRHHHPARAHAG